jgi:hypothetical protein
MEKTGRSDRSQASFSFTHKRKHGGLPRYRGALKPAKQSKHKQSKIKQTQTKAFVANGRWRGKKWVEKNLRRKNKRAAEKKNM